LVHSFSVYYCLFQDRYTVAVWLNNFGEVIGFLVSSLDEIMTSKKTKNPSANKAPPLCFEKCKFGRKHCPGSGDMLRCSVCQERWYHLECLQFPSDIIIPFWSCPSCIVGLRESISLSAEIGTLKARMTASEIDIAKLGKEVQQLSIASAGQDEANLAPRLDKVALDLAEVVVRIEEVAGKVASTTIAKETPMAGSIAKVSDGARREQKEPWIEVRRGQGNGRGQVRAPSTPLPAPGGSGTYAAALRRKPPPPAPKQADKSSRTASHGKKRFMAVNGDPANKFAIIGDSIVKHVHQHSRGVTTVCMPGAVVANVAEQLEDMKTALKGVTRALLHVGSNNIANGQTPASVVSQVKGLVRKAQTTFSGVSFGLSAVLYREDASTDSLGNLNKMLLKLANDLRIPFVDANLALGRCQQPVLDKKGVHLNRRGAAVFSSGLQAMLTGN
jgi:hypothetical protein